MDKIFFNGWQDVLRTLIITILAYVALVIILRNSGKRTLSKMNAFDFVITIALGSALATISMTRSVTLASGIVSFIVLIGMQYIVSFLSIRVRGFRNLITNEPSLLVYNGQWMEHSMRRERVTREEIYVALRSKGLGDPKEAAYVIMETTGSLTVVERLKGEGRESVAALLPGEESAGQ